MSSFTKTVTEKQLAANQANAWLSTGPSTPEAKAKVSLNRISHGLCGTFRVLAFESQEQFDQLLAALMEAEKPADASETELVVRMAKHSWLSHRALRMQNDSFTEEGIYDDDDEEGTPRHTMAVDMVRLNLAMRYHSLHDRAYRRAAEELVDRRSKRQLAENGIERKKHVEADAKRKNERHELTLELGKLKKQGLEIRNARIYMSELSKIQSPQASKAPEFALTELKSAA
jgi:hypothetical protein